MNGKAKAALLIGGLVLLSFLAPKGAGEGKKSGRMAGRVKSQAPPAAKGFFLPQRRDGRKVPSSGTPSLFREGRDWEGSLFQVGGATLLVLVLAGGAVFLLSRIQRSRGASGKRRALALVETLPLGRRKRLVLARASERLFLLGETEKGISLLAELGEEETLAGELPQEEDEDEAEAGEPVPDLGGRAERIPFRRILKAGAGGGG